MPRVKRIGKSTPVALPIQVFGSIAARQRTIAAAKDLAFIECEKRDKLNNMLVSKDIRV